MELINLTNNIIHIIADNGLLTTIPKSGIVANCSKSFKVIKRIYINGNPITISKTVYGEVSNLPEYKDGILNIVYKDVAEACNRADLVFPHIINSFPIDSNGPITCIGLYSICDGTKIL